VFVELKARFDEERNILWARKLEQAGARVVYGVVGVKTHAKVALVVRREGDSIRRYAHIGTGNYNAMTAALYADLGLLTSDPALTGELNDLFNELSGSSRPPTIAFRELLVAPGQMLVRFIELIDREAAHAQAGRTARIRAQMNGLADPTVIRALYRASQAGVDIDLVVRGICCLRPGVPGLSDRIRVTSIVGRFLEHARIFCFANGGEPEYFIGSADWRSRNLRRRIEVVVPVRDPQCRARLDRVLQAALGDPTAWELDPDGSYSRLSRTPSADPRSAQERWMEPIGAGPEPQSAASR
jgi:polyphosphate kinase